MAVEITIPKPTSEAAERLAHEMDISALFHLAWKRPEIA